MSDPTLLGAGERGNLPHELTTFIELPDVHELAVELLSSSRLVTMLGTGGAGKTRMALRVAAEARRDFVFGAWFVDLSGLTEENRLPEAVASAMRIALDPGRAVLTSVINYLREKDLLLVLDNCEHLVAATSRLVDDLLAACPGLRILTTSRAPVGSTSEVIVTVRSMSFPTDDEADLERLSEFESVALFLDRARRSELGYVADEATLHLVGQICQRLEGLPLAIELAVGRLRVLSLSQILERLSAPHHLLAGGRTGPDRQRTLWTSIGWSYELCAPGERLLWERLSVFADGCELDSAEAVCGFDGLTPEDVLDCLQSLVEKSIVARSEVPSGSWYRMAETIRAFGVQKLVESGTEDECRRRHWDWYRALSERAELDWVGPRQRDWLRRMHRKIPNLRQALDYSLTAMGAESALRLLLASWVITWWAPGLTEEMMDWLARILAVSSGDFALRGRALTLKASVDAALGQLNRAELDEGRRICAAAGDAQGLSFACTAEALVAPDHERSIEWMEQALVYVEDLVADEPRLTVLAFLAAYADGSPDRDRARGYRDRLLEMATASGEMFGRSNYLLMRSGLSAFGGDFAEAAATASTCLRLKRDLDHPIGAAMSIEVLAAAAAGKRDFERAATLLGAADLVWGVSGALGPNLPGFAEMRQAVETQAAEALGNGRYRTAYGIAGRLDIPQALAWALGEVDLPIDSRGTPSLLTPRELEVAELVAQGLTNKQIAAALVVSARTVEGHVDRIRGKLGLGTRTQVAAWVLSNPDRRD